MNRADITRREFPATLAGCLGAGEMLASQTPVLTEQRQATFNVVQYGAKGDGASKDTGAIQAAIDACYRTGGGTIIFPSGTFLSGSLHLRSGLGLHLGHGARLLASPDEADFEGVEKLGFHNDADRETSFFHHALIWAEDAQRIAITGTGTIDGNRKKRGGPKPIAFKRCKFVTVSGIAIVDAPNYAISLLGTDYVLVDGVSIRNGYADGIDPDCCHHVRICNCQIESWDDAIVAKTSFSLGLRRSTENLLVTNCILQTNCNALKLGTESGGDFKNIAISNCAVSRRTGTRPPVSGISLLSVDGSNIDGVVISNIAMRDVRCPLFLRLGNRGRDMAKPIPGSLRNVIVSNLVAEGAQWPCAIAGIPEHAVEGVTLHNVRISYQGGTRDKGRVEVPEHVGKYPSADMFGLLPAYGVYCRHARDLHLSGLHLGQSSPDFRSALICEDVSGLIIDSLKSVQAQDGGPVLSFHQVWDALVRGCRPGAGTDVFLKVSGAASSCISLMANDFSGVKKAAEVAADVPPGCVTEVANRR